MVWTVNDPRWMVEVSKPHSSSHIELLIEITKIVRNLGRGCHPDGRSEDVVLAKG